jgi:glycosyltransferase involved in cell wall biosynthesis
VNNTAFAQGNIMNVAFVNATKIWGGVKTWILTLGKALAQRGHNVSVVGYPGIFLDVCQQHGLEVLPLRFGFDGNPWAIFRLTHWFYTHNVDHVVTNIEKDIYVAGVAARFVGARVLNRVGSATDVKPKGKHAFLRARMSDAFIAPSSSLAAEARERAPWLRDQRINIIYSPVDTRRFSPPLKRPVSESGQLHIGITGRLVPGKGHRFLLEALGLLPPDILAGIRVHIAGDGPLENELRIMAAVSHLEDRVRFAGFSTSPERFLQQIDIAVFPSLREGLPNALLEAMSCGLPVVASAVGGVPEVVSNEKNGLLVPPEDSRGIADALLRLCRNKALREALGGNARREIVERFAAEVIAEQFERLCEPP